MPRKLVSRTLKRVGTKLISAGVSVDDSYTDDGLVCCANIYDFVFFIVYSYGLLF